MLIVHHLNIYTTPYITRRETVTNSISTVPPALQILIRAEEQPVI